MSVKKHRSSSDREGRWSRRKRERKKHADIATALAVTSENQENIINKLNNIIQILFNFILKIKAFLPLVWIIFVI